MRTLVIPDLHGRWWLAEGLLRQEGLLDQRGRRLRPGDAAEGKTPKRGGGRDVTHDLDQRRLDVQVIQLGDLVNCVPADRDIDLKTLHYAPDWFDVVLVGNHEHPYYGGHPFLGFFSIPEVKEALLRIDVQPCALVGTTLLTHAGVAGRFDLPAETAAEAADAIRYRWGQDRARDPLFSGVGRARGGSASCGGLLWSDWSEARDHRFDQIHGHTPLDRGPGIRHYTTGRFTINLDCGGHGNVKRLVGVWLDSDGGPDPEFVTYETDQAAA